MTSLSQYLISQGEEVTVIKATDSSLGPPDIAKGKPVEGVLYKEFSANMQDWRALTPILSQTIEDACESTRFDCCVASFGPFTVVPSIISVWERYPHIPLVVDYRDPWIYPPVTHMTLKEKAVAWYIIARYRRLEKRLMDQCTAFVSVTPRYVQTMNDHYPVLRDKSHCIYNGYTHVPDGLIKRESSHTKIYVLGKLSYYSLEGTIAFFQAVKHLLAEGHPIQVIHIGKEEPQVEEIIKAVQLPESVYFAEGQQSYNDTIMMARNADIFVAIDHNIHGLNTKIFDYIYLNKPIVAYSTPTSELAELISCVENAFICQSEADMETALRQIIVKKLTYLTQDESFRAGLSRTIQNEHYYQLLQDIST